jgi:hypothetical protein
MPQKSSSYTPQKIKKRLKSIEKFRSNWVLMSGKPKKQKIGNWR